MRSNFGGAPFSCILLHKMKQKLISLFIIFIIGVNALENSNYTTETNTTYDPCCAFPCQNGGICSQKTLHSYECDCTDIGYSGTDCRRPYFSTKWKEFWSLTPEFKDVFLCGDQFLWFIINHAHSLHEMVLKKFYAVGSESVDNPTRYNIKYDYATYESHFETCPIARVLPQVPVNCPTPLGALGPKLLPDELEVFEKIFRRRRFKPDPSGSNLLFLTFTEHLSLMLFKTEKPDAYSYARLPGGFDSDHIYGTDEETRRELRTMRGGKLKTSSINGEIFPPILAIDAMPTELIKIKNPKQKVPPPGKPGEEETLTPDEEDVCQMELTVSRERVGTEEFKVRGCTANVEMDYPEEAQGIRFALAHPQLAMTPFLIIFSTIWIREHNRVAFLLSIEHPDWDDERIYQTTRLVVTGEMIHITMTDYLKQLTQYNFDIIWDPNVFNHKEIYSADRMNIELHQLKHWHAMFPDCVKVGNGTYNFTETYYNNKILTRVGFDVVTDILIRNPAGKVTYRNYAEHTRGTIIHAIREGRKYRLQSLNNYRKHLGLEPHRSMYELCGEKKLAKDLELFYGDVNAVEFFVGMAAEKLRCSVFSPTQMSIGGPYIIKSLLSNPINTRGWWKPSTFGGEVGYDIVKSATIKGLFCNNRMEPCKGEELISFHVPTQAELDAEMARKRSRLWCLDDDEIRLEP